MRGTDQPFSITPAEEDPAFRARLAAIALEVLRTARPDEADLVVAGLPVLIDLNLRRQIVALDHRDDEGAFGAIDLLAPAICRLVVEAANRAAGGEDPRLTREDVEKALRLGDRHHSGEIDRLTMFMNPILQVLRRKA